MRTGPLRTIALIVVVLTAALTFFAPAAPAHLAPHGAHIQYASSNSSGNDSSCSPRCCECSAPYYPPNNTSGGAPIARTVLPGAVAFGAGVGVILLVRSRR